MVGTGTAVRVAQNARRAQSSFHNVWKPDLARYLDFTLDISVRARYLALGPRYLAHRDILART